ncbi:hypothetical protein [Enterococcus dongliensis]|uniref:Lipoprotein n=1 Tax=Enterococcus dongliensis TaxID=2559925 RepID=A0ABU3EQT4_9ENTE|nr:hypothetical protein [Enterococcus dongliensis]MDT2597062.1 hypothetical protein [Enterococcus dongliensis]
MKKIVGFLLVSATLLFSACSNDKKAESTDASSKQETKVSSTNDSKKEKEAEAKKKAEEAEKKKQEEISKKVIEADTAMKSAEANPTDETIAAAKTAIESIPGGNNELLKRLETTTANLEAIKQQAAVQAAAMEQAQQTQDSVGMSDSEWKAELARRNEIARQDEINAQAEFEKQVAEAAANAPKPTIETDENGRTHIFENHDAYKNEPYYTEDWKNNPSPYQNQ